MDKNLVKSKPSKSNHSFFPGKENQEYADLLYNTKPNPIRDRH